MPRFKTTVYLVNEFTGSSVSDQFSIPLTRLQQGSDDEIDAKMAAAKAWIEAVGQYHKEKMELMGAPAVIREAADSQAFVVGRLEVFPLCLNAQYAFVFEENKGVRSQIVNSGKLFWPPSWS